MGRNDADLGVSDPDLFAPLSHTRLVHPAAVRLLPGRIVYSVPAGVDRNIREEGYFVSAEPGPLLWGFLSLFDEADESVFLGFAQSWGVLGVCQHGWSLDAHRTCQARRLSNKSRSEGNVEEHWEPIETWRTLARQAAALLDVGHRLRSGWKVEPALLADLPPGAVVSAPRDAVPSRKLFAQLLGGWLFQAGVRPCTQWDGHKLSIHWGRGGTLAAVGTQLMLAMHQNMGICWGCGRAFERKRPRRSGLRTWCSQCRKASRAAASRDYRERKGEALALFARGIPPERIAKRLDWPLQRISGWIQAARPKMKIPSPRPTSEK